MNYVYQMITTAASDGLGFAKILVGLDFDIFFFDSSWVRVSSKKCLRLGFGYQTHHYLATAEWHTSTLVSYFSTNLGFD